jgi:hypothetical protein
LKKTEFPAGTAENAIGVNHFWFDFKESAAIYLAY